MKENEIVVKQELIRKVGKVAGVSQEKTEKVYDALCEVIAQLLEEGKSTSLINVGRIEPKYMPAKPERDVMSNLTGELVHKEAEPACYRVHFSVYPSLIDRLKVASYETPIT